MQSTPTWKAITGLVLATSMWAGAAGAGEQFQTLAGIQAEAMSPSALAAVEGRVTNAKFFSFNPRFFGLQSLLGKGGLNLKGTLTPLGELRLPILEGGVLNFKGALHDKLHLIGPFDPQGRLNLHYREAADKGAVEFHLSSLPELLNLDSIIRTRDHALQLNGVLDPKGGLNLLLEDHSTDSGELRLSGLLGLLNLNLKGGIGDGQIQPVALLLNPKTGLTLNPKGSFNPSAELQLSSLPGLLDLSLNVLPLEPESGEIKLSNLFAPQGGLNVILKGAAKLSGKLHLLSMLGPQGGLNLDLKGASLLGEAGLQLTGLFDPKGGPKLTGKVSDTDAGELQLTGLLGLLNLNFKGAGGDAFRLISVLDPKSGPSLNFKGGSDDAVEQLQLSSLLGLLNLSLKGFRKEDYQLAGSLQRGPGLDYKGTFNDGIELDLSGVLGSKGGLNLLNLKGISNEKLPLIGLLDPKGLNLNLLGLSLLGRR